MKARSLAVNVSGTTNRSGRMPPPPRTTRPRSVWNTSDESTLLESRPSSAASACASWSSSLLLLRWMVRPLGVYQRAVVSLSATSGVSGYSDCTSPLPNVGVPTTTARSWSCSAPVMISAALAVPPFTRDRKSTRLNSSHGYISYAVFCLKKKKTNTDLLFASPGPTKRATATSLPLHQLPPPAFSRTACTQQTAPPLSDAVTTTAPATDTD